MHDVSNSHLLRLAPMPEVEVERAPQQIGTGNGLADVSLKPADQLVLPGVDGVALVLLLLEQRALLTRDPPLIPGAVAEQRFGP